MGKGRQIAATILEHQRVGGQRALWVSVSADLKWDAGERAESSLLPAPAGRASPSSVDSGCVDAELSGSWLALSELRSPPGSQSGTYATWAPRRR